MSYIRTKPKHSMLTRYWSIVQFEWDNLPEGEEPDSRSFIAWDYRHPVVRTDPYTGQKRYEPYDYMGRHKAERIKEEKRATFKAAEDGSFILLKGCHEPPKIWRTLGLQKPPKPRLISAKQLFNSIEL